MEGRHVEEVKFWQGNNYAADLKDFRLDGDPNGFRDFRVKSADETRQLIADTRKAVANAEELLGDLHIDKDHGLSRRDIQNLQADKKLSATDKQSLDILLTGGKTPEELFNSKEYLAVLEANDINTATGRPNRLPDPDSVVPKVSIQDGRLHQFEHYMNDKTLTPEMLTPIKATLDKAGMAVRILDDPDFFIANFMEKLHLDPAKDTLTPKVVWSALADKTLLGQLRDDQVKFLMQVQEGQRSMFKQFDHGMYATTPDGGITVDSQEMCFDSKQLKCLAERWAVNIASDPALSQVVGVINHTAPTVLSKAEFLHSFEIDKNQTDFFVEWRKDVKRRVEEANRDAEAAEDRASRFYERH